MITKFYAKSFNSQEIGVYWEYETQRPLNEFRLELYRAETPGVDASDLLEFTLLNNNLSLLLPGFVDETVYNLNHHNRKWYYALKVVDLVNLTEEIIKTYINSEPPTQGYKYVRKQKILALKKAVGRPFYLLKKRSWGPRCEVGWDEILQAPSGNRCDECTCYGTGFYNAYFTPIEFLGMITENPKITQIALFGEFMPSDAMMSAMDYPPIEPRDVVVDNLNRRWYVKQTRYISRFGVPFEQICQLGLIHPTDELYEITIP